MAHQGTRSGKILRWAAVLFLVGLLLQIFLGFRGWIMGDQFVLLDLGLDYLESGHLKPAAKSMSGGGVIPGGLLQFLIGGAFSLWHDYRAPVVLLGLMHVAAGLLLAWTTGRAGGTGAALFFILLYWLSPWRLYHAGLLWEPCFLFLPAALHFWSSWKLREKASWYASAVMAAALLWSVQLHGSFLLLWIFTATLVIRRRVRFHWVGGALGAAIGSLTLIPSLRAVIDGTMPMPTPTQGFFGSGLIKVYPVLKGFLYWFRMASLDIGRLKEVVFLDNSWVGGDPWRLALKALVGLLWASAVASIVLAVIASWWLFRKPLVGDGRSAGWLWLRTYSLHGLLALLAASALSPVTIQGWHVVVALPATAIPLSLWLDEYWPFQGRSVRWLILLFLLLRIPESVAIGLGHPAYRPFHYPTEEGVDLSPRQRTLLPPGR